jgi:hypothetical protein
MNMYQTARGHIPQDTCVHIHRCENMLSSLHAHEQVPDARGVTGRSGRINTGTHQQNLRAHANTSLHRQMQHSHSPVQCVYTPFPNLMTHCFSVWTEQCFCLTLARCPVQTSVGAPTILNVVFKASLNPPVRRRPIAIGSHRTTSGRCRVLTSAWVSTRREFSWFSSALQANARTVKLTLFRCYIRL